MSTMPLPEIIRRITALNNCNDQLARTFITEFSNLVANALSESGSINIKGLGTFRRIELGNDVTVEFAPDAALAEAVNSPFAMFEPFELDDEVTEEMLDEAASEPTGPAGNTIPASAPETEPEPDVESELPIGIPPVPQQEDNTAISAHTATQSTETEPAPQPVAAHAEEPAHTSVNNNLTPEHEPAEHKIPSNSPVADNNRITHEKIIEKEWVVEVVGRSHHFTHLIITAVVALVAGLIIGCYTSDLLNLSNVKSVNISADDVQVYHQLPSESEATSAAAEPADTASVQEPVPTLPTDTVSQPAASAQPAETEAKTIVTDTVRSNRFLTTMAREYYGKKKFWVYIYEENRDRLSNPDRIEANTVVVIPPAEKYGIKAGDKASEDDAERRAAEIMSNR